MLPPPGPGLARPGTRIWPAGQGWHRIHASAFGPTEFNPCKGRPTRFAPLRGPGGDCVPTLYAAASFDAAAFETLFHDIGHAGRFKTLPLSDVAGRHASVIAPRRDLRLAALFAPELKLWEVTRAGLIASPTAEYDRTAAWAATIHAAFGDLDGLVWTSNQCDPDLACLLFGDRVGDALTILSSRDGATDPTVRADARRAGLRAGITLVR